MMTICLILGNIGLLSASILLTSKLKKKTSEHSDLLLRNKELTDLLEENAHRISDFETKIDEVDQLALVTQQTENAVMLMNAEGDILWVNESFTRMYEYTYEEFTAALGNNIRKTSFNPKIMERLERCKSTRKAVVYEALNITKSGKEIWTRTSLLPLVDELDSIVGLVTVDSNIHQRVVATEELIRHIHSSNEKIERIAEQLTAMVELTDSLFERINIAQRRIERTDQIVKTIKQISDETKILGINASIEAHAAGENGKGFRVIANEIVNVSNTTNNSLHEISELISKIQSSSDKLINEKEQSEVAITEHRSLISELKREINEVQCVIEEIR